MATQKTDAELLAQSDVIREETQIGGNTRDRVATMVDEVVVSKISKEDGPWVGCKGPGPGFLEYDASTGLWPDPTTMVGTGPSGTIRRNNTIEVRVEGTVGGIFWPVGTTFRALGDTPGQVNANWKGF